MALVNAGANVEADDKDGLTGGCPLTAVVKHTSNGSLTIKSMNVFLNKISWTVTIKDALC